MSSDEEQMEAAPKNEDQKENTRPILEDGVPDYAPRTVETMLKEGFTPKKKQVRIFEEPMPESSTTKPEEIGEERETSSSSRKLKAVREEERSDVLDPLSRPSVSASLSPNVGEDEKENTRPKLEDAVPDHSPRTVETMLKEGFTPKKKHVRIFEEPMPEPSTTKPVEIGEERETISSSRNLKAIPKEERSDVLDPLSRPSMSASLSPEIRFDRERREMSVSPARKTITDHSRDAAPITAAERSDLTAAIGRKTLAPHVPLSFSERRELRRSISTVVKEPETPLWFSGDMDEDVEGESEATEEESEKVEKEPMHRAPELIMARSRFAPPGDAHLPSGANEERSERVEKQPVQQAPELNSARSRFAPPAAATLPSDLSKPTPQSHTHLARLPTKRIFPTPNLKDEEVLNPFSKKERRALVRSLSMSVTSADAPLWKRESEDGRSRDEEPLKSPGLLPPELEEVKKPTKPKPAKRHRKVRVHVTDLARSHAVDSLEFCTNKIKSAKYSLSTFLPMNLFTQCCRAANLYFILIASLQLIPGFSPTSWGTTMGPLVFVFLMDATKEGIDDFKRNRSDRLVNKQKVDVVNEGQFVPMSWRSVVVGDIVRVKRDDEFPADLVFLSSSDPKGLAYIETSNLDGEPSLKTRNAFYKATQTSAEEEDDSSLSIFSGLLIECELPNNRLYRFDGAINLQDYGKLPLDVRQVLLRGATLRNTDWILGAVVYTGADTKFVRNMLPGQRKVTELEKNMNILVAIVFLCQVALCIGLAMGQDHWARKNTKLFYAPYNIFSEQIGVIPSEIGAQFGRFLILLDQLIPISLYVTLEIVKVVQSYFLDNDLQMYHEPSKTFARARTTNLNEDLGQVQHVMTDKTGTLTQNMMAFVQCSVNGAIYGNAAHVAKASEGGHTHAIIHTITEDSNLQRLLKQIAEGSRDAAAMSCHGFFSHLAICHVIQPVQGHSKPTTTPKESAKPSKDSKESLPVSGHADEGPIRYVGPSPDEEALVQGVAELGYKLTKRSTDELHVEMPGRELQKFAVLATLEFTSERKRMSIICRDSRGRIKLYCKGADTVLFKRLGRDQDELIESTLKQLEEFARYGFRTLCMAEREISDDEYEQWADQFRNASVALDERDEKVAAVAEEIERDLTLLGATAVEDKLQAGVAETVTVLALAGIKVWVLTGDKLETSVSVGLACNLLADSMHLFLISDSVQKFVPQMLRSMLDEARRQHHSKMRKEGSYHSDMAIVVEGISLSVALEDSNKMVFLELCQLCRSVICCRVSPIQKAQVTRLVKDHVHGVVLAIGDGANDVGMLKVAQIGVGVGGREGMAAVLASDYAITRFRHLRRLLLVHGRWSYKRNREVVMVAFYKNMVSVLGNVYFAFYSGFSAQSYHSSIEISMYNLLWTSLLPFLFAVFEKDMSDCTAENNPQLYRETQSEGRGQFFWCMLGWIAVAVWDSLVSFFFPVAAVIGFAETGESAGLWIFGSATYGMAIFTVNLKLIMRMHNLTLLHFICLFFSTWVWILFTFMISVGRHGSTPDVTAVGYELTASANFWLLLCLCPVAAHLPAKSLEIFRTRYAPDDAEVMREIEHGWIDGFFFKDAPDFVEHVPIIARDEEPPALATEQSHSALQRDAAEKRQAATEGEIEAENEDDDEKDDDDDLNKPTRRQQEEEDRQVMQPRRLTWREVTNEDELEDLQTSETLGRYGRRKSSGFQIVTRHTDQTEVPLPLVEGPTPPARKSVMYENIELKPTLTLTSRKSRFSINPLEIQSPSNQTPPATPVPRAESPRDRRARERKERKEKERMREADDRLEASPMDRIKSRTESLKPSPSNSKRVVSHAPRSSALHPRPSRYIDTSKGVKHPSQKVSASSSQSQSPRGSSPPPKKTSPNPRKQGYETPPHSPRKSSMRKTAHRSRFA